MKYGTWQSSTSEIYWKWVICSIFFCLNVEQTRARKIDNQNIAALFVCQIKITVVQCMRTCSIWLKMRNWRMRKKERTNDRLLLNHNFSSLSIMVYVQSANKRAHSHTLSVFAFGAWNELCQFPRTHKFTHKRIQYLSNICLSHVFFMSMRKENKMFPITSNDICNILLFFLSFSISCSVFSMDLWSAPNNNHGSHTNTHIQTP